MSAETRHVDQDMIDDEYDEEADSDFDISASDHGSKSSDEDIADPAHQRNNKKSSGQTVIIEELDSGDEVTIQQQKKKPEKRKQKTREEKDASEADGQEWRAKTRSMRAQEKEEKKQKKLTSTKPVTVDIDKVWEEMNKPGPLPPVRIEGEEEPQLSPTKQKHKLSNTAAPVEEMITIKRQFKFAGEVHVEEKVVPKSSAEAQLWLAQHDGKQPSHVQIEDGKQRPLRKISRFDPNYANLEAFRNHAIKAQSDTFTGPKLNVVEKSKMDWAVHVDSEGLKDELNVAAKAKDAYLNRMDFLGQVEQRKEEEARTARQKG